jgi:hypothetical protein
MPVKGAQKLITESVMRWPDVTKHRHRFGGTEYCLGERREIGHVHGDAVVDIPFPIKVRDELIAARRAELHHFVPEIGAVSFFLRKAEDVERAIELLRLSYDLAVRQKKRHKPTAKTSSCLFHYFDLHIC